MRQYYRASIRLAALALLALGTPRANAQILYKTGFEAPTFTVGQLVGQDGWSANFSANAAVISTASPKTGLQAIEVQGGLLESVPDAGVVAGTYRRRLDYDTAANGTPIIDVQVDVVLKGPNTGPGIANDLISANVVLFSGDDLGLGAVILSSNGNAYAYSGDFTIQYQFETPMTLGDYHTVELKANSNTASTDFVVDGMFLGTLPFDPAVSSTAFGFADLQLVGVEPQGGYKPADYAACFDNYSITAAVP